LPEQVKLLSCKEIIRLWNYQQEYASDDYYDEFHDKNRVRGMIEHKTRIPIAEQEDGGFISIDNDPGPKGTKGQIIFLVDECEFIVLADSFKEFISSYIKGMKNNTIIFYKEEEDYCNKYRLGPANKECDGEEFVKIFKKNNK